MNQAECVVLQSLSNILRNIFLFQQKIFGKDNKNTSAEYNAFVKSLKVLDYIYPDPTNHDVDITNKDELIKYMSKINETNNMLQYIVPIPKSTKISSQYIIVNPYQIQKELNINIRFYPRNTRILWLIGDDNVDNSSNAKTIIYIHGGSYIYGGASHLGFASRLSIATQTRVVYICYDMPPLDNVEIPYQVDQILSVYFYLTVVMEIASSKIIISGDSAGGGLTFLLIQKLGINALEFMYPAGVIAISPWFDLGLKSKSYKINDDNDIIIDINQLKKSGEIITRNDETKFQNAFYSALFGETLSVLPPIYIIVSKHETLFNDTQQIINKFKKDTNNKIDLKYDIEPYMFHDWVLFLDIFPEAEQSFNKIIQIVNDWNI